MSAADDEELSQYEKDRLANIARNKEKLRKLGLEDAPGTRRHQQRAAAATAARAKASRARAKSSKRRREELMASPLAQEGLRRSSRHRGKERPDYKDVSDASLFDRRRNGQGQGAATASGGAAGAAGGKDDAYRPEQEQLLPYHEPVKYETSAAGKRGASTSSSSSSSAACSHSSGATSIKDLNALIDTIDKGLGTVIPGMGPTGGNKKGAIMFYAAPSTPKFSKYSGIAEWRNCIYVFVNVGGKDYDNVFMDGGERMTWFAQPRHTLESPVIRRCLSGHATKKKATTTKKKNNTQQTKDGGSGGGSGGGGGGAKKKGGKVTPVYLWLRFVGGEYLNCGQVVPDEHDASRIPLRIVWRLTRFDELKENEQFKALVAGEPLEEE